MKTTRPITIRGIVIAADWDNQGGVLRIAIVTYDEDTIGVLPDAMGQKLISCLRKPVTVRGVLHQGESSLDIEVLSFYS